MYLFSYEKLKTLECSSQHNLWIFSWTFISLLFIKVRPQETRGITLKMKLVPNTYLTSTGKKYCRNPLQFIVAPMHLTHAFILLSSTRKKYVNFISTCIHSMFLILRILDMHTNAYTFIYAYEYMSNFYKIIQKLHNISIYLSIRGI